MLANLVTLVILGIVLGILAVCGAGLWWMLWRTSCRWMPGSCREAIHDE